MSSLIKKIADSLAPSRKLVYVSLAVWVMHIILRVLLLFRNNAYGFPFVSKPDWYIFHAVCLDFMWIVNSLLIFTILGTALQPALKKISAKISASTITFVLFCVFHSLVLETTIFDHELQRFMGCHISIGLVNTYKDVSSLSMFWDYAANDRSIPFLQFFVLALAIPFTYGIYRFLLAKIGIGKKALIAMLAFYVASFLYVNVIWTGSSRMDKLRPVVSLIYNELETKNTNEGISKEELSEFEKNYQDFWLRVQGDSLWYFPGMNDSEKNPARLPLYKLPREALLNDTLLKARRAEQPNFIVVFMESHRGMNVGFLNPNQDPSPTPFYDSIAAYSHIWERMHASGIPTTGGILSTHTGTPHHSTLAQATELTHVSIPSFASILTESGYSTHYFSAADPAWDNLGVWMSKWYTAQHYNRNREDDSTFFDHATEYVIDTLAKEGKPFLATLATRSNHYPFNFAAGMTSEQKQAPLTERINYTMNYADRQLARFIHQIENKDWYKNTYVIILADHGFPLGENGVSTMVGGGFSNVTWIPFIIYGKDIKPTRDSATCSQQDIAPTILELAGIVKPNIFMGHNLLRNYGEGLSLGAYTHVTAISHDGLRLVNRNGESEWMFAENDMFQKNDIIKDHPQEKKNLEDLLNMLVKLSDYTLERGF